jgi:hypothetical protein
MGERLFLCSLSENLVVIPGLRWGIGDVNRSSAFNDRQLDAASRQCGAMTDDALHERLARIEAMLSILVAQQKIKDFYQVDEFAKLTHKAPFTVREWARLGRIRAEKRKSGRGASTAWVVSHQEWLRYQHEGLLPEKRLAEDD